MDSGTKREQRRYGWCVRIVCVMYAMQVCLGAGMVCYAGICVCYMMRYGYALCGTGRLDGGRYLGMRYVIMSGRAIMHYAMATNR